MIPRLALAPGYEISRLIKGGWHLAGGHGSVDPAQAATRDMARFVDAGITTFDCADIYTGVEELIGRFRREYPDHARRIRVHTKFVPDLDRLATLDGAYVAGIIDRSLARLGLERLDLVQFHWWDYATPRYVEVALQLERLRRAGKIDRIGLTNFGTPQVRELLAAGVPVFAHQLQYSLLDDRPEHGMAELCTAHRIALLCYGTVAGWLPVGPLARPAAAGRAAREPLADQVPADHRGVRRLAGVPGAAGGVAAGGGPARLRRRHGRDPRGARPAGRRRGDRRRHQHRASRGAWRHRPAVADGRGSGAAQRGDVAAARPARRRLCARARPHGTAWAHHEIRAEQVIRRSAASPERPRATRRATTRLVPACLATAGLIAGCAGAARGPASADAPSPPAVSRRAGETDAATESRRFMDFVEASYERLLDANPSLATAQGDRRGSSAGKTSRIAASRPTRRWRGTSSRPPGRSASRRSIRGSSSSTASSSASSNCCWSVIAGATTCTR
jgi:aryl-alcohol dehydrogenase-like predicted oxidoreductase